MIYITTSTGIKFDLENPTSNMINIVDIAHALANLCHWNGQCREFFSIAQHCVMVSRLCPENMKLYGLLHDASEAYYGDVSRPLKVLLPEYKELERKAMSVIYPRFGLKFPEPAELKQYDNLALYIEAKHIMQPEALHDGRGNLLDLESEFKNHWISPFMYADPFIPLPPKQAKHDFLQEFNLSY